MGATVNLRAVASGAAIHMGCSEIRSQFSSADSPGLSVEEFQQLVKQLEEPFHIIALVCICFGLRISECLALRWSDVDSLNGLLKVERGIVHQVVDDVKTPQSNRAMHIDTAMLQGLKDWKQLTQFSGPDDWMFASPSQIGRLPWSYAGVWRRLRDAAVRAGIGHISSHTFRHYAECRTMPHASSASAR